MPVQFTITVPFNVTPEKVYDGLTNLGEAHHWMKGYISIEMIKGNKIETGAVFRETRKFFGKPATEEFEVVSAIPNKEIKFRIDGTKGSSKKGEYLFHYALQPNNGGTDLTVDGQIRGLKGFSALMAKLFAGMFKKSHIKELNALRAFLESKQ